MDFSFSDEQLLLTETVQRFVREQYTFETRRDLLQANRESTVWSALADLGLTAINVAEEYGGLGGNAVDTMLVMNAFGEGLVLEPFIEAAVLTPALIARVRGTATELLSAIASGERIAILAHEEPQSRGTLSRVAATATPAGGGFVISGRKSVVGFANRAHDLLVSARLAGDVNDANSIGLFRIDPRAAGVRMTSYRTLDGHEAADIELTNVAVDAENCFSEDAFAAIEAAYDVALSAICAEAVGIMKAVNATTLEYLKNRKQFGQPIGRFQVLQHRMADMYIHAEQATSMSYLAAIRCTDSNRTERRKALSAAKVLVGQAGRFIAQQSIQLHGGMGMTDEMRVSHYFKRLTAIEFTLGDMDTHLQRFTAASA
ncbi:MAG TPA: acyl-CoA dehydrogenase family protein [Steroidobacteraceae bacterium]|nr:acyl-CoA dehydrogenase family protein [Steroidobacteraceae bacterium]